MTNRDRSVAEGGVPVGSLWEGWYPHATPAQRQQALALVRQQGLVHAHQLPPAPAAARPAPLARLLAGHDGPFDVEPVTPLDAALDACQRLAVARALSCPDVSLVQGPAGSGKTRVLTEVLRQAMARGWRTLVVASPGGLRAALGPLADREGVVCLSDVGLPGAALTDRVNVLLASAREAAREAVTKQPAARTGPDEVAARGAKLVSRAGELRTAARDSLQKQQSLNAALEREWGQHPAAVRARDEAAAQDAARLAKADAARQRLAALDEGSQARADARPGLVAQIEARKAGRWWSWAWWQAALGGDPQRRLDEQLAQDERALADRAAATDELAATDGERPQARAALEARLAALREQELASRRAALEAETAARQAESAGVEAQWAALVPGSPVGLDAAGLAELRQRAADAQNADDADRESRVRWLRALEESPDLGPVVLASARVVAADPAHAPRDGGFDLLILDEAHRLADVELEALTAGAKRSVLFGEPELNVPVAPPPRGTARPPLPVRAFRRLWGRLYADPRRWPTRWTRAAGRLVASLRPLTERQAEWVLREPVYDRPDVELTIVAPPDDEPFLAEVTFPDDTPLTEARGFIFREHQTLAIEAGGPNACWSRRGPTIALDLLPAEPDAPCVTLDAGVRERLTCGGSAGWVTAGLEFDADAGWDAERARQWAATKLGVPAGGRATSLSRAYRHTPELAAALDDLLHGGGVPAPGEALRFVPVPPPADEQPWANAAGRARTPRGAGLESELSDPRRPLPPEVRSGLPGEGVVNVAEAEAVVAHLREALADAAFAARVAAYPGVGVAVLSAFPAQAALLRGMIARAGFAGRIEATTADGFRQRECLLALVSLTRSHAARAVPLSAGPDDLAGMLTRAAERVVLFGDGGTLARRTTWFGALDHQDEHEGPREQALARAFAAMWPDAVPAGEPAPRSRSRESSSV